jgi:hypothetical protein
MPPILIPVLIAAGLAVVIVSVIRRALHRQQERKALVAQHPNEPWLWRKDWANRAVEDVNTLPTGFLWFFGIFWTVMSSPLLLIYRDRPPNDRLILLLLLVPLLGVAVMLWAAYGSLRKRKYGVSVCHIDHVPAAIGKRLRGSVVARLRDLPAEGFRLELTNLRRVVTGSGKNRSVHERVLWQDEQVIRSGTMASPDGMRIPFAFDIPRDGEPTDDRNPSDRVIWRLDVGADVPGIDYGARFELPVFSTGEVDAFMPDVDPRGWTPPADSGVKLGIAPNGEEVVTRGVQSAGNWIVTIVFFTIWFGALAFVRWMGAPAFVVVIFALFSLLILVFLVDLFLGRSRLVIGTGSILTRRTWLGIGGRGRTVQASEIESVATQVGMTAGSKAYHDVVIKLRSGRTVRALRHIARRRDAEMLAAKVRRAVQRD